MSDEKPPMTPQAKEKQLSEDYLDDAIYARQVTRKALEVTNAQLKAGTTRDPAKAAVSAATAGAIALDKRLVIEGRPTVIHAVDPGSVLNALARRVGLTGAIEAPAVDVTPIPQSYGKPKALETQNGAQVDAEPAEPDFV